MHLDASSKCSNADGKQQAEPQPGPAWKDWGNVQASASKIEPSGHGNGSERRLLAQRQVVVVDGYL
eukprot:2141944-Pleurochrysis_carterae.AAC.1